MEEIKRYIYEQVMSKKLPSAEAAIFMKEIQENLKRDKAEEIAIIGIDCRFPHAGSPSEYWDNLINGRESIRTFPENRRLDTNDILARNEHGKEVANYPYQVQGYLEEIDKFDANFFNISPAEAKVMDPAQRLFLETAWGAIEDAGLGGNKLYGTKTGVYVGKAHFGEPLYRDYLGGYDQTTFTGSVSGILASRISYILNLSGPSIVVDTACSSGLVALHLACQALDNNECDLAIAGGISLSIMPTKENAIKMLESPNGVLKPFDKDSDGTIWGEGVGALLLKPLSKAIADNDNIYGIIKGSGINNDGASNGITAPSAKAQEELLVSVWQNSKIDPETISYIESHGTGTALGDPIEIRATTNAFRRFTSKRQFCGIGSVKANIGHLIAASGIAGIIKIILALKNGEIPATVCFNNPSSFIDFCNSPVYLNDSLREWDKIQKGPRRAGISSFGLSGTNCHVIIEEAPIALKDRIITDAPYVLTISAKKEAILREYVEKYKTFLFGELNSLTQEICYTSNTGRGHYGFRLAIIVHDENDLKDKISKLGSADFNDLNEGEIFYGQHKVIATDKKSLENGEIDKNEKLRIDREADKKVTEYIETSKGNLSLLEEICCLYVKGANVEWERVYENEKVRRVSIPTYPFERKRSWIGNREAASIDQSMYFITSWAEYNMEIQNQKNFDGIVLILKSGNSTDEKLVMSLRNKGITVIEAEEGQEYKRINNHAFYIRYTEDDFVRMLSEIGENSISHIIHMATLNQLENNISISELERSLRRGVYSLFYLTKAITTRIKGDIDLILVSEYANEVTGKEKDIKPHNAAFFSLGKVIAREYKDIHCKLIDIDSDTTAEEIINEMNYSELSYQVAYRKGIRYVEEFKHAELNGVKDDGVDIKNGGTYVIFGGTGGIGLEVAKFFSSRKKVNLALISRSGMPERESWKRILHLDNDKNLCAKIRAIESIEGSGTQVSCFKADIAIMGDAKAVLDEVKNRFGSIDGVIQCAGVGEQGMLVEKSESEFNKVLYPKVYGTWLLDNLTCNDKLDFFIMFSSVASIFSMPGQGVYAAANAYMDAFSTFRRRQGKKTLSINWVMWKETGMATKYAGKSDTIFKAITTDKAMNAFEKIIRKDISRVLVGELNCESRIIHLIDRFSFNVSDEVKEFIRANRNKVQANSQAVYEKIGSKKELHPMLQYLLLESMNQDVYITEYCPGNHWVMGQHKVMGNYVIPGLAYPELAKQASKQYFGDACIELRDFVYITPFIIHEENDKKNIQVIITKNNGKFGFIVASKKDNEDYDNHGNWTKHVEGEFVELKENAMQRYDIKTLQQRCNKEVRVINFNKIANGFFEFGPRWVESINLGIGENTFFSEVILPPEYEADLKTYELHPAMMDLAVNAMGYVLGHNYLPLSFKSFKIYGSMPAKCYTYITSKQILHNSDETLKYDIDLMNSDGVVFGELRDYTIKKVHDFTNLEPNKAKRRQPKTKTINKVKLIGKKDDGYTQMEEEVAKVWGEVLGYDEINIYDNFYELGGDSILAMKLINEINRALKVNISVTEIFSYLTISEFAQYLQSDKLPEIKTELHIQKAKEAQYYPLSSEQKRQYAIYMVNRNSTSYNNFEAILIEGELDIDRVENAFKQVIERHEVLQTSFSVIDGEPVQEIHKHTDFNIEYITCEEAQIEFIVRKFIRPFDLEKAPLIRVCLAKMALNKFMILFDIHHIISDGTTISILFREFIDLYKGKSLPELRIQYKDFAVWQSKNMETEDIKRQEEYWINSLSDELPILNLPLDFPRPKQQSFEGETVRMRLDNELTEKIRWFANKTETTLYVVLLSIYNVLIMKYTGQEDIIVGSPILGRKHADLENMLGMFVNTLVMRNFPSYEIPFIQFLNSVKRNTLKAFENQDFQFDKLVEELGIQRNMSRNPIFDTMFVLQNIRLPEMKADGLIFTSREYETGVSKLDLTLEIFEDKDILDLNFEYCTKLFKRETIECMARYFVNIIKTVIKNSEIRLMDIEIMQQDEKRKLLFEFNNTEKVYPKNKTVYQMFEEQVERTPDKTAVLFEGEKLTYRELNHRANQLARTLRQRGVKAESIVGIMLERSLEMSIGLFGIIKAGGAYLPIDPMYPQDRINFMLEDSGAQILLTKQKYLYKVNCDIDIIDLEEETVYIQEDSNLEIINKPTDLIYVIYTSGSTGKPKGTMIEHYSVINRLNWMQNQYPIGAFDVILQKTPFTFDVSVWELFWWSLNGASMCFLKPGGEKDPELITSEIERNNITTMHFVPSMLSCFLEYIEGQKDSEKLRSLKHVFSSGEALHLQQVERFNMLLKPKFNTRLINLYGPTEATVDVSHFDCSLDVQLKVIPIGKPIDNTKLIIIDKRNKLQPIGVVGELCISGDGLARGYLNRPKLTTEKFVPNPYEIGQRMYRTGDLARWLPDGNIEYLGRMDFQVKLRGLRIELGEIEECLLRCSGVKETLVTIKEDANNKYLCAYYVSENPISIQEFRKQLLNRLPEYMVPSYFIHLKSMPLTQNGKINRRELPEPIIDISIGLIAASSEREEKLAKMWEDILNIKQVGVCNNFFELGGHSIKAIELVSRINKEFDIEINVLDIFNRPTIRELAEYLEKHENSGEGIYSTLIKAEKADYYPVSSVQKRVYVASQLGNTSISYNMTGVRIVEGKLDRFRLENAFRQLIKRHETLRTSFEVMGLEIVQRVHETVDYKLLYEEGQGKSIEEITDDFIHSFDLSKAPLFRTALVKIGQDKHVLLFDTHHIICDGFSVNIIVNELCALYLGKELPKLTLQYKDFAVWQNMFLKSDLIKRNEHYWCSVYSDKIPILNLKTDYKRPNVQNFDGDRVVVELDKELSSRIKSIALETGSTVFMILLTCYYILLSKYTGQEDIVIGSPIESRPHHDLQKIIGMFVDMLALRNYPSSGKGFLDFLNEVKESTKEALANQNYQYEQLVNKLNICRDPSRNPLFDVVFSVQEADDFEMNFDNLKFIPYIPKCKVTKFDIVTMVMENMSGFKIVVEYITSLYKRSTIERMTKHYVDILEQITSDKNIKLKDIKLSSNALFASTEYLLEETSEFEF